MLGDLISPSFIAAAYKVCVITGPPTAERPWEWMRSLWVSVQRMKGKVRMVKRNQKRWLTIRESENWKSYAPESKRRKWFKGSCSTILHNSYRLSITWNEKWSLNVATRRFLVTLGLVYCLMIKFRLHIFGKNTTEMMLYRSREKELTEDEIRFIFYDKTRK